MLKIGSAYKIKSKIFDGFFTDTTLTKKLYEIDTNLHIGKIFTVLDVFEVSKNNFYYGHYRFKILFEDKIIIFLINKHRMLNNNINKYLEEII